jgi:hypothetical protein
MALISTCDINFDSLSIQSIESGFNAFELSGARGPLTLVLFLSFNFRFKSCEVIDSDKRIVSLGLITVIPSASTISII